MRQLENVVVHGAARAVVEQGVHRRWIRVDARHFTIDCTSPAAAPRPATRDPANTDEADISLSAAVEEFQRQRLRRSLERHGSNKAAVARAAGMDRSNLNRLMKRLGIG